MNGKILIGNGHEWAFMERKRKKKKEKERKRKKKKEEAREEEREEKLLFEVAQEGSVLHIFRVGFFPAGQFFLCLLCLLLCLLLHLQYSAIVGFAIKGRDGLDCNLFLVKPRNCKSPGSSSFGLPDIDPVCFLI